jgi:4-aminobutyrate aminotransferase-like enzyme
MVSFLAHWQRLTKPSVKGPIKNVVRFAPPLMSDRTDLDGALDVLLEIFQAIVAS